MEKEIPISQEKNTRASRLREASRILRTLPLDRSISDAEWESATGDLSRDDLDHLKKLAAGYRDRAIEAGHSAPAPETIDEAGSALLLWPRDPAWAKETFELYKAAGWTGPEFTEFFQTLEGRLGRKKRRRPIPWVLPFVIVLLIVPAAFVFFSTDWTRPNPNSGISRIQGPRTLETVFDTQGVKTNIQVAQSRMVLFPDATVAELSAWVTFPDHRVDVWEGSVVLLDAQGQPLAQREVTFHSSREGPLDPGQGVEIFEQFDAWPFFNRVSTFQVLTKKILAQEAHPQDRREMPVQGLEALTAGYSLKVWVRDDQWTERFASRVHTMALELENVGLKPFAELQFALVWKNSSGKTLKTLSFRPVSAFRTALPSGARLPWVQETIFDSEVFSWAPGEAPHPILELKQWQ